MEQITTRSLEEQRAEFAQRPLLATPLAGMMAWLAVAISGIFFSDFVSVWVLFGGTGSIVYLALFISKFTGENLADKSKPKNVFDNLFLYTVGQAVLVYAIAIPFFLVDYTSLPLTVGILTGIMWIPLTWIIQHWVGLFHGISRTLLVVTLWYLFPTQRFVFIPLAIVLVYIITLIILRSRRSEV